MADDGGAVAVRRAWQTTWTTEMKESFLDHLAATCSVNASAVVIGVDPRSVYHLRRTNTKFRAAWAQAIACGYDMLETQLIGHALASDGGQPVKGGVATTAPIDISLALALLTQHRSRRDGARDKAGPHYKVVTAEQTNASILRKLKAMERHRQAHP